MRVEPTPGPWRFNPDFAEVQAQTPHGTAILAVIQNGELVNSAEEAEANGHVMAAGLVLLAACEAVLLADREADTCSGFNALMQPVLEQIRTALASARGEEEEP